MSTSVLAAPRRRPGRMPTQMPAVNDTIWRIRTADELHELLRHLRDSKRQLPMVIGSPHGHLPMVDLAAIADTLHEQATVAQLDNHTAALWQQQTWPQNCAWGGATRLFGPTGTAQSELVRCYPTDDVIAVGQRIIDWVQDRQWTSTSTLNPAGRNIPVSNSESRYPAIQRPEKVARSRAEARAARKEADAFRAIVQGSTLFSDPVERFRHEVELMYLVFVPETERQQWPRPRHWKVDAAFVEQVDTHARQIPRDTILRSIIDVLTGRARNQPCRHVRPHRTGPAGNDPQQTRNDGAKAYRANVQNNTAGARRLTWWRKPDGIIELADLAAHDASGI